MEEDSIAKDKKAKLANTRKRFKELQELKKKKQQNQEVVSVSPNPTPTLALDNDTPNNNNTDEIEQSLEINQLSDNSRTDSPLINYFDSKANTDFFDNITASIDSQSTSRIFTKPISSIKNYVDDDDDYKLFPTTKPDTNENKYDYSALSSKNVQNESLAVGHELVHNHNNNQENNGNTSTITQENTDVHDIQQEINYSYTEARNEVQHSNVESLRQLSDQMAQMMDPKYEFSTSVSSITDLEKRNLELASLYDKEKLHTEQLQKLHENDESRIRELEDKLREMMTRTDLHTAQEMGKLKDELQTHFQTIGLLVAEKTELASHVTQFELSLRQKSADCEELNARLKASRSRVADLERELATLKSDTAAVRDMEQKYLSTLKELEANNKSLKEHAEELTQDLLEVREKLKNTSEINIQLQQTNQELSSKLSLADIKIQQLTAGESAQDRNKFEALMQEKFSLEKDVATLNQTLKTVIQERDESSAQYQQYAQQLNAQITALSVKLDEIRSDKDNLLQQEQNRIKHIGELERQLQNYQENQLLFATKASERDDTIAPELCIQLQMEKTTLEESYTKVANEKELLLKELDAKNDSISQLESYVEQLRGNQPDSVKLLAAMESDKVAAARAIQQNKELKHELESMQEVVLKLNSDKMELTEQLMQEHKTNKDLFEKLQQTELHLQSLADAIEIKDREMSSLRESLKELNKKMVQNEQIEDRLRHFEAHDHSSHIVQQELQEAQHTILELRNALDLKATAENIKDVDIVRNEQELQDANQTILKLKNEINELKLKLTGDAIENDLNRIVDENLNANELILDKDNTLKCLEEKVKKTMQEIADLSDEKQRLEHIVLQLQGETETIGEYVALYQHQRLLLKEKAMEKDQQLQQLAADREQIKFKLDRLNELIGKVMGVELVRENNVIDTENVDKTESAAEEIINLLSEIKTSNLVQPSEDGLHHCPWCSGQLIVV